MCELFAMSARKPSSVDASVEALGARGGGSGPHADGWGIAWYEGRAASAFKEHGVYFARAGAIGEWAGAVYLLEDDKRLRGLGDADLDARTRTIGYDVLTDLITGADAVAGMLWGHSRPSPR